MESNSTPLGSASPYLRGRSSIAALFKTVEEADSASRALAAAGFPPNELRRQDNAGGILITVESPERLADAANIMSQCGGGLADGDAASYEAATAEGELATEADEAPETTTPVDAGLTTPTGSKPLGGGTFTRGSVAGGSGGGTATGGSLFGSSR